LFLRIPRLRVLDPCCRNRREGFIPRGTPGTLVASESMYAPTTLPPNELEIGAISDPAYLSGRTAAADILPGQRLTATDFAVSTCQRRNPRAGSDARALAGK
jgi:hypothetical protein